MKRCAQAGSPGIEVRIRVCGRLDNEWSAWFEGLTVCALENGETLLTGAVADQASLHGVLARIRDLGLPLLHIDVSDVWGGSASQPEPEPMPRSPLV